MYPGPRSGNIIDSNPQVIPTKLHTDFPSVWPSPSVFPTLTVSQLGVSNPWTSSVFPDEDKALDSLLRRGLPSQPSNK